MTLPTDRRVTCPSSQITSTGLHRCDVPGACACPGEHMECGCTRLRRESIGAGVAYSEVVVCEDCGASMTALEYRLANSRV